MHQTLWQLEDVSLGDLLGESSRVSTRVSPGAPGVSHARVEDVNLSIGHATTAILGPSGSGKTSLLNLLVGYEKPSAGKVTCCYPTPTDRLSLFWAPQDDGLWPHLTTQQHVQAVLPQEHRTHCPRSMHDWLNAFDLVDQAGQRPGTLSLGQRSRLSVMRCLASGAKVMVMDEPLVHVDVHQREKYWHVIAETLQQTGSSLIFALHEPGPVLACAKQVICMDRGKVIYDGDVTNLYWQPKNAQLMHALGPGNWLCPQESATWLNVQAAQAMCYRPSQLRLQETSHDTDPSPSCTRVAAQFADPSPPCTLVATQLAGPITHVTLQLKLQPKTGHASTHATRQFALSTPANAIALGRHVKLSVISCWYLLLSLCLASLGVGCDRQDVIAQLVPTVQHYWQMPADGSTVPSPRSVNIGPDDQVIVLDKAGRVLIYNDQGVLLRQWRMPDIQDGKPEDACWLKDGRIAIADTHYHRVLFFSAQGKLLSTLGSRTETAEVGKFHWPVSITQDADENIYVAEYGGQDRIQKFSREGQWLLQLGSFGTAPGQFSRIAGIQWAHGKIYIADAGNGRVQVFEDDGRFVGVLGSVGKPLVGQASRLSSAGTADPPTEVTSSVVFDLPYDVAVDFERNWLYVIQWGAGQLTRLTLQGQVLGQLGSPGSDDGQFRTPWSVAVDSQSRVRVADTENRRLVEYHF